MGFVNFRGGLKVKKWTTKMLVEAGIMIALAFVLSRIKVYQAPNGGSVTAGSMIPIILFAMRWGLAPGVIAGAAFGMLKLVMGGWFFSPAQVILEYPIAFGVLGLAGIYYNLNKKNKDRYLFNTVFPVFLAIGARFICHLLAGVIFFSENTGGQNPWLFSAIYQSSYLVPEFIVSAILISIIWKPIQQNIKAR